MKHVFKVFLASMLATLLGCTVVTSHHASEAENHPSTKQDTKLVATYKTSQVDAKTMKQFKSIAKEDPNFHIKKQQGKVIIEELFGSVAKIKLYAHLYKTIKANIVLTVKSFVSINYFSFFSINIT